MGRLSKSDIRLRRVKRLFRVHAWMTGITVSLYAILGFFWGPTFSFSDFREVWRSFADDVVVSATVPPPPSSPVVSAEARCPSDTLLVSLDWADDPGATSFDVYRNSTLLVSGLSASSYDDVAILNNTAYTYEVVAYGPMDPGMATSAPVLITTPDGCLALRTPTIAIVSVGGADVSQTGSATLTTVMPSITGTSNMPNASVSISIVGASSYSTLLSTNINGYWEWMPTANIPIGAYTLTATVTHPLFPLQTASDTLALTIQAADDGDDDNDGGSKKKKKRHHTIVSPAPIPGTIAPISFPVSATLRVSNPGGWVFQGRSLETELSIDRLSKNFSGNLEITYTVLDGDGAIMLEFSQSARASEGDTLSETIPVPRSWNAGEYRLVAQIRAGKSEFSTEASFRVVELPLLDLGGGMIVTGNEAVRALGWASLWMLLFLLLLLLLFAREYWLFLHARETVSERDFPGRGFFRSETGKEVRKL